MVLEPAAHGAAHRGAIDETDAPDTARDPNAVDSPCGPQNGKLLPPVEWNDALVAQAAALVDTCPIFVPRGDPALVFVHWSPDQLSKVELLEIAIQTWASERDQYNFVTGNCLRPGDTSYLSYKTLVAVGDVAVAVKADCPNNRSVAAMYFNPNPLPDGPAYPPLLP